MYDILKKPPMDSPVLVSALSGWVDAASAGTDAAARLAGDAEVVARFDPDALFDYRSQRPILDIVDGVMTKTVWPEVVVRHRNVDGRDLLVLTGQEPDLAWTAFACGVAEMTEVLGVVRLVTLGSVPAPVPHTIPPPILATASDRSMIEESDVSPPDGLLRVPAAAVSIVDQKVQERGLPTIGFYVRVPHYVTAPYPQAVQALLRRLEVDLRISIDLADLEDEIAAHRRQLDEVISGQPEAEEHVRALEAMNQQQAAVSGEDLASEIEKYLRDAAPPGERGPFEGDD